MKTKFHQTALLIVMFLVLNCQNADDKYLNETSLGQSSLKRDVGKQIPFEQAQGWLKNLQGKTSSNGWEKNDPSFSLDPTKFKQLLTSLPGIVGLVFHYGIDENDVRHVIVIPIDETLSLFSSPKTIVDANSNTVVQQSVAREWIENYRKKYPDQIRSHFFGVNILNEINSMAGFSNMEMKRALSGEGIPQLLLFVWREGTGGGRIKSDPLVYDYGDPCPPRCTS